MWTQDDANDIGFLDDSMVELIEEPARPAYRRNPMLELEDAVTRVWIRPYAARHTLSLPRPRLLATRPLGRCTGRRLR
ncbi:MAG: hypothetical protein KC501_06560 [Myxococcales bacterium]|nr:hypothetical protein [Myxococcales bacterium]